MRFPINFNKKVSQERLKKTWKRLTDKPFPPRAINCYLLNRTEFDHLLDILSNSSNIQIDAKEYGERLPRDGETDAFVTMETKQDGSDRFLIVINRDGFYSVNENIEHELKHIIDGDIHRRR